MKNTIQLIIILSTILPLKSQELVDTLKTHKIFIGISGSANYTFRKLSKSNTDANQNVIIKLRNENELYDFGYNYELNLGFILHKNIVLKTGIGFGQYGFKSKTRDLIYFTPPLEPNPAINVQDFAHFNLFSVPLKLNYILTYKKFDFGASIGSGVFLPNSSITYMYVTYQDGSSKKIDSYNDIKLNPYSVIGSFSFNINYNINKRFFIALEPEYRRMITPLNDNLTKTKLYTYSLNLSVNFKL